MSDVSFAARDEIVPASAPFDPAPRPVRFIGDNREFRRLVMRGALLEIVTAGFYRFWLATKMRRHLWSSTIVGDDALEYVGAPRELLFGFFFSLVFLAPAYFAYFLLSVEAERYEAFASLPLLAVFAAFSQFANYGALRYRLRRTIWRGLRFGMSGSRLAYMMRAIGWGAAIALTLGFALPWAHASLERYKMRNTFYGDLRGDFVARGGGFFKRGWWVWAATIAIAVAPLFLFGIQNRDALIGWLLFVPAFAAPGLYAAYKTQQWRWWIEGLRLGDIRAETRLTTRSYLGNIFAYLGTIVGIGLVSTLPFVLANILHPEWKAHPPALLMALWIPSYVVTFVAIGVATRIYCVQRVWKIIASSLILHGLETAENVSAQGGLSASAINEGFADNLDVLGF